MDLLPRIKGMYRLLELFSEQGSGGAVDKIIISQDSVSQLVEQLYPGAYSSLTKVWHHLESCNPAIVLFMAKYVCRLTLHRSTKFRFSPLAYTEVSLRLLISWLSWEPSIRRREPGILFIRRDSFD
jgi:hypothetical protein